MKTTYVLGAGCSVSSGAPHVAGFPRASDKAQRTGSFDTPSDAEAFRRVRLGLRRSGLNIEEYYIACEMAGLTDRHELLGTEPPRDVQWFIAKTLQASMEANHGTPGRRAYARLVSDLSGPLCAWDGNALLSLNWDTCIETAAAYQGSGVHVPFQKQLPMVPEGPEVDQVLWDTVPLLKLHGSMNWWFCDACEGLLTGGIEKAIIPELNGGERSRCRVCQGPLVAAMVPPLPAKLQSSGPLRPLLSTLWRTAADQIASSDRLVFAGYSLPPTDLQFRILVRSCLGKSRRPEIVVVSNPGNNNEAWRADYAERLGVGQDEVTFDFRGFTQWVARRGPGYPPQNELQPW